MSSFAGLTIGLVGPLPPPAGGMANQTRQLAELLQAAGAGVLLVQTNRPYPVAWIGGIPVLRAAARLLPYLGALWRMSGRSDVVHVMANSGWSWHLFAAPAIWIASLRRRPVVVNYRGGDAANFLASSKSLVATSLARVSRLVVPSGFLQEVFSSHGWRPSVVPNIVDVERFRPAAARPGGDHLVISRNLEPIYDNETALHVLACVRAERPNARLTIAGTGPEAARLQALAAQLGLANHVRFAGRLDRDEVAALLRDADVVLNTSLVDNMPNSVLEALASGVPVVSTDVGGVRHVVQDGTTALLVPPRSPEIMARAVLRVLDNPALAAGLSTAGLAEVQRYTWSEVARQWADVYRSALAP